MAGMLSNLKWIFQRDPNQRADTDKDIVHCLAPRLGVSLVTFLPCESFTMNSRFAPRNIVPPLVTVMAIWACPLNGDIRRN